MLYSLIPFIYSLFVGAAWAYTFKKKFLISLAPAYMFQILVTLCAGMIFHKIL